MKLRALLETGLVFWIVMGLIGLVAISPVGVWERQLTNRPWLEYSIMIAVPLFMLIITGRPLAAYGLSITRIRAQLAIVAATFWPVAIAAAATAFVDYRHLSGALTLTVIHLGVLWLIGALLARQPVSRDNDRFMTGIWLIPMMAGSAITIASVAEAFFFYVVWLGFGEELLFRGYLQSRLNAARGRPFHFYGIRWGWGLVIASAFFGLMHALNLASLTTGVWTPAWWWGVWTTVSGLVFGLTREHADSVYAPALLHGLPQAIACALMGC